MFKTLIVEKFLYKGLLGEFVAHDVNILIPEELKGVTKSNFNPKKHEHFLSSFEVARLSRELAQIFWVENNKRITVDRKVFTSSELNKIRAFLNVNNTELGQLLGLDKSQVSRLMNENSGITSSISILIFSYLKKEIEEMGYCRNWVKEHAKSLSEEEKAFIDTFEPVSAFAVAEYFVRKSSKDDSDEGITNLKLQKLLYFAEGHFSASFGKSLLNEKIHAWPHGPVVKKVYEKYSSNVKKPLKIDFNLDISDITENKILKEYLDMIYSRYGQYSAWKLRDITHQQNPWKETEKNKEITKSSIQDYFKSIL
ncbi:MAG: SocA family protein [Bacteriovoracaceae bacterium]|nr:SocA family protein [Bacteriovoracaceae bacterium]